MIITDNFVLLAFPKTGTSYTTNALRTIHARRSLPGRIYPQKFQKRDFPRPGYREHRVLLPPSPPSHKARSSRHGTYADIPDAERHKQIVSVVRNPFSQYTSAYLFQTRMRKNLRAVADPELLKARYPNYPQLHFDDYYDMLHRFEAPARLGDDVAPMALGLQSINFIKFYFKTPSEVFRKIDRAYIDSGAYKADMADIFFLHQETLREDFVSFLRSVGYSEKECRLAENLKQKNVSRRNHEERELSHFYDESLRGQVLEKDRLIFTLFPEYALPW